MHDSIEEKFPCEWCKLLAPDELLPVLQQIETEKIFIDRRMREAKILLTETDKQGGVAEVSLKQIAIMTNVISGIQCCILGNKPYKPVIELIDLEALGTLLIHIVGEMLQDKLLVSGLYGMLDPVSVERIFYKRLIKRSTVEFLTLLFELFEFGQKLYDLGEHKRA